VPIIRCGRTIGVLFAESQDALCFGYDDQDALDIVADNFGTTFALLEMYEGPSAPVAALVPETAARENLTVRYYPADNSVFIDGDYLIKGVAGAVFWKLVREYVYENRCEFTNRELRLDPVLRLPAFAENLEARLVLLYRRLAEDRPRPLLSHRGSCARAGRNLGRYAPPGRRLVNRFSADMSSAGSAHAGPALLCFLHQLK
jgi:adenylate cyclase